MASKTVVPAVEGWFTLSDSPQLIGKRCTCCGTYLFPPTQSRCPSPRCSGQDLEETMLSTQGKLWSFTSSSYAPPPPYRAADPFEPFLLAAVELEAERIIVLGQVTDEVDIASLSLGMEMRLVLDELYEEDGTSYLVWKWTPVEVEEAA